MTETPLTGLVSIPFMVGFLLKKKLVKNYLTKQRNLGYKYRKALKKLEIGLFECYIYCIN